VREKTILSAATQICGTSRVTSGLPHPASPQKTIVSYIRRTRRDRGSTGALQLVDEGVHVGPGDAQSKLPCSVLDEAVERSRWRCR